MGRSKVRRLLGFRQDPQRLEYKNENESRPKLLLLSFSKSVLLSLKSYFDVKAITKINMARRTIRDAGYTPGQLPSGPRNSILDVNGKFTSRRPK